MKRCAACGNIGDDNSTVCEVCGKPYETAIDPGLRPQGAAAEDMGDKTQEQAKTGNTQGMPQGQQRRRMRSGPQIYGQSGSVPEGGSYDQQGMVRRSMQGRSSGAATQGAAGYSGAAPQGTAGYSATAAQSQAGYRSQMTQNRAAYSGGAYQGTPGYSGTAAGRRPVNGPVNGAQQRTAGGQAARQARPVQGMTGRPAAGSGQMARRVAETARKMLGSPLFLIIAVLDTLYLIGSVAAIFMGQLNYSQYARVIQALDLPSQVSGYVSSAVSLLSRLDSGMFGVNLALRVPDLMFCIGLWLVFVMAVAARDRDEMSGIGFVFMKADIIINMLVACLVMLVILVAMVATVVASWVSGNTVMIVATIIALVATIIVVMMVIMYYFSYMASLTTCRVNGDTGEEYGKVSAYVAVLHIILGLLSIIGLLSGIVNSEIAAIVSSVGRIGWMVLFGVWMLMYRGRQVDLEE